MHIFLSMPRDLSLWKELEICCNSHQVSSKTALNSARYGPSVYVLAYVWYTHIIMDISIIMDIWAHGPMGPWVGIFSIAGWLRVPLTLWNGGILANKGTLDLILLTLYPYFDCTVYYIAYNIVYYVALYIVYYI